MEMIKVHNRSLDAWFIVDEKKVYDAATMVQLPEDSELAKGAIRYVKRQKEILRDQLYTAKGRERKRMERDLIRVRIALGEL